MEPPSQPISRGRYAAGLIFIALVAVGLRYHLITQPLDRDEGFYAYVAQRLLDGDVPYRDTFSDKPPLAFLIYGAFISVLGESAEAIHIGGALWVAAAAVLIAELARRLYGSLCGLVAGLLLAVTFAEGTFQGSSINLELLLTPIVLCGLLLLLRPAVTWREVAGCGALLGLALLTKQQAVGHAAFGAVWLFVRWWSGAPRKLGTLVLQQGVLASSAICVFLVSACIFYWNNALHEYLDGMLLWNLQTYVPHQPAHAAWSGFRENFMAIVQGDPAFYALAAAGLVATLWKRVPHFSFAPLWVICNLAGVCIGWRFYRHYFLFTHPGLVLLAAWTIARAIEWSRRVSSPLVLPGVVLASLLAIASPIALQFNYFFRWTAWEHVLGVYGKEVFAESKRIAKYIAENSSASDRIYIQGSEPQIYFLAHRRGASRYAFAPPLTARGEAAAQRQRDAYAEIVRAQPRFIVVISSPASHMTEFGASTYLWDNLVLLGQEKYTGVVTVFLRNDRAEYRVAPPGGSLDGSDYVSSNVLVLQRRE
jgi:4-amino-4-deoxy-L-arabinose transferase-like glycosyltransferase